MGNNEIEIKEELNTLEIATANAGIRSLEELIEVANIDLDVWEIPQHTVNPWPTTMKDADGNPISVVNWQIKAKLVRKEPILLEPKIEPVQIRPTNIPQKTGRPVRDIELALILPDPQFGFSRNMTTGDMTPFHDRLALDVALQIASQIKPSKVVWLGDMLDLPDWSTKFLRKPEMYWTTQAAVIEGAWWISQFRKACGAADHYILEGNHDKRLENMVVERLAVAYDLKSADEMHKPPNLSVQRLLGLQDMGVEYVGDYPNGRVWLNDTLCCRHGITVAGNSGGTVGKIVNKESVSVIHGHIHRRETATRTIHMRNRSRVIFAHCPGCLCDISGRVPGRTATQNWQQGISLVYYTDQHAEVVPVSINQGKALWNGQLWSGRDHVGKIKKQTGWSAL